MTSLDPQKSGTDYCEFNLPDPATLAKALETTLKFFIKQFDQTEAPETCTTFHKGFFTHSILRIVPNIDKVYAAGDNPDISFSLFDARPHEQQQFNIEVK